MEKINLRLILVAAVAIIVALVLIVSQDKPVKVTSDQEISAKSNCQPYRADKTVRISSQRLAVEVADTLQERQKGLGGRTCITDNEGMLFVFDRPGHYQFWMKDMHFPINIVWIGADHKVAAMEVNVSPKTYPDSFVNKDRLAQYVLEIKANRSKSLGIDIGTPINF